MTRKESARIQRFAEEWREFGSLFGWRLYGFDYDYIATFLTDEDGAIECSKGMREAITERLSIAAMQEQERTDA